MMILVNFDKNGQPNHSKNLQDIKSCWKSKNGEIPRIVKREGSLTDIHLTQIDSGLPVTEIDINGKTVTCSEGGTKNKIDVSAISLDKKNNQLSILLVGISPGLDTTEIKFEY